MYFSIIQVHTSHFKLTWTVSQSKKPSGLNKKKIKYLKIEGLAASCRRFLLGFINIDKRLKRFQFLGKNRWKSVKKAKKRQGRSPKGGV